MSNPLLLFRVGHMVSYDGPGEIHGGGSHVVENGTGGEMWNFAPVGGRCFGYVMSSSFAGLDLGRLAPPAGARWEEGDELAGVDVGFFARRMPGAPQTIVGGYLGATVFHRHYRRRPDPGAGREPLDYLCEVDAEDAILLPVDARERFVPFAPVDGPGYPGQSHVWYGDGATPNGAALAAEMRAYLRSLPGARVGGTTGAGRGPRGRRPDQDVIREVEKLSMAATRRHFDDLGYRVEFVHRDNSGWDVTASKGRKLLRLEVKGHLGDVVHFELTPNEYAKMQAYADTYRVCLVRSALTSDRVEVLAPVRDRDGRWSLVGGGVAVALDERIGAKASEPRPRPGTSRLEGLK